jgi:CDP-4-dehydro-6-deoxyglucose reductase
MQWYTGEFIKIEDETDTTKRFWVKVPEVESFDFEPGQFITMDLPIHEKKGKRLRSYSIANAPNGSNVLELVIVYVDGGAASQYFWEEVEVGTEVEFLGPLGKFLLPEEIDRDICMVCTGTGIAPFRSMLYDLQYNNPQKVNGHNIYLIFGTRYTSNILYRDEFDQWVEAIPALDYRLALSREEPELKKSRKGYVHPWYQELFKDQRPAYFFLCGWRRMIMDAKERLEDMGYGREEVHYEIYD